MDDQAIVVEVQKAIWAMGGCSRPASPALAYLTLEQLNADPELLGVVGSWRKTGNDDAILESLREWNRSACEPALAS